MSSYYEKMLATGEVKCIDEEIPFEVPKGWEWCRLRNIILGTNAGKSPNCEKRPKKSEEWGVLTTTSIQENAFLSNENKVLPKHYVITPEHCVRYGDILITRAGPVNRTGIVCMVENNCDKLILSDKTVRIDYMHDYCNPKFLVFVLNSSAIHELVMSATVGMAASQVNVSQVSIQNTLIPFPPSKEQQRIIDKLGALLPQIEKYDNAQNKLDELNKTVKDIIKKSVLQEAIQGKLVSQREEEGTAKELLEQIEAEKQKLVKEGKLKKSALSDSVIFRGDDNKYYQLINNKYQSLNEKLFFKIPTSWCWVQLRQVAMVARGGSPRPIKDYLTDSEDGINWIKIGDTEQGGKYINATKEKICPKGVSKSRFVHKGNFLLTNSMSFGRPYITNIDGCIHDGWLVISPFSNTYNQNFLYYLLSSNFAYRQFVGKVAGGVVKNLNSDKVADAIFPLPPLEEQQRIVAQIEKLFEQLH